VGAYNTFCGTPGVSVIVHAHVGQYHTDTRRAVA